MKRQINPIAPTYRSYIKQAAWEVMNAYIASAEDKRRALELSERFLDRADTFEGLCLFLGADADDVRRFVNSFADENATVEVSLYLEEDFPESWQYVVHNATTRPATLEDIGGEVLYQGTPMVSSREGDRIFIGRLQSMSESSFLESARVHQIMVKVKHD